MSDIFEDLYDESEALRLSILEPESSLSQLVRTLRAMLSKRSAMRRTTSKL